MLYEILPYFITRPLVGRRREFNGGNIDFNDPEWIKWKSRYTDFYNMFHGLSLGLWVESLGHSIVRHVDMQGKTAVEAGPGMVLHFKHAKALPARYIMLDISKDFLEESRKHVKAVYGIDGEAILTGRGQLPLEDSSVDVFLTFQQLEHVDNLEEYAREIKRVLKPGGVLVGAVPAEGGLLWGLGRYFTTRRKVSALYGVDYDKIICWEHPNTIDKIEKTLDSLFTLKKSVKSPIPLLPFDFCATWSFIYSKD